MSKISLIGVIIVMLYDNLFIGLEILMLLWKRNIKVNYCNLIWIVEIWKSFKFLKKIGKFVF